MFAAVPIQQFQRRLINWRIGAERTLGIWTPPKPAKPAEDGPIVQSVLDEPDKQTAIEIRFYLTNWSVAVLLQSKRPLGFVPGLLLLTQKRNPLAESMRRVDDWLARFPQSVTQERRARLRKLMEQQLEEIYKIDWSL